MWYPRYTLHRAIAQRGSAKFSLQSISYLSVYIALAINSFHLVIVIINPPKFPFRKGGYLKQFLIVSPFGKGG
jgi:hypothetical protein